jgi:hypothetical protein
MLLCQTPAFICARSAVRSGKVCYVVTAAHTDQQKLHLVDHDLRTEYGGHVIRALARFCKKANDVTAIFFDIIPTFAVSVQRVEGTEGTTLKYSILLIFSFDKSSHR